MTASDDRHRLAAAYRQYEQAQVSGDRQLVCEARRRLCDLLERGGWTVPGEVRDQLVRDEKTLRRLSEAQEAPLVVDLLRPPSHRFPVP